MIHERKLSFFGHSQTGGADGSMTDTAKAARDVEAAVRDMGATISQTDAAYQKRLERTISLLKERSRLEKDVQARMSGRSGGGIAAKGGDGANLDRLGGSIVDGLNKVMGGGKGAGGGGGGGLGGLGALGGIAGAIAGPVAGIAGAVSVIGDAAGRTAAALNILGNSSMTAAQKERALFESMPIIGGMVKSLHELRDAIDGTADRVRQAALKHETASLSMTESHRIALAQSSTDAELDKANERAAAGKANLESVQNNPIPHVDRSTFQGEIKFREQQRMTPLQDAKRAAEADLDAAKAAKTSALAESQKRLDQLMKDRKTLGEQAKGASALAKAAEEKENRAVKERKPWRDAGILMSPILGHMMSDGRDKAGRAEASTKAEEAQAAVMLNEERIQAEINRQKQLGLSVTDKESAVRKANIAIAREELSVLQEKEARLKSQATRAGGLNVMGRRQGLQAAKLVKEAGGDLSKVAPEVLQAAEQFAPEYIQKIKEKFGQGTDEYKEAQKEGFYEKGDIKETQQKIDKVQTEVRVDVALDTASMSEEVAKALGPVLEKFVESIKVLSNANMEKLRHGQQMRNNAEH